MRSRRHAAAVLAVAGLLVTGCGGGAGDKSGGSGPTRVLVLANNDGDLTGVPAVARFVAQLAQLSGGRLTVRVASRWQSGSHEAQVIRDVAAGKADLGWSGTRAFDTVEIAAFQPLHAPHCTLRSWSPRTPRRRRSWRIRLPTRCSTACTGSASPAWPWPPTSCACRPPRPNRC